MPHPNNTLPAPAGPLADPALRRYMPQHIADELDDPAAAPRMLIETFVQLACARYTIGTYLPRHLIERAVAHRAQGGGPWLEWVDGALLFADVSGSTALAERLTVLGREGTEIVTGALNDFFDTMIAVTSSYGGDLLSFGGDALLIFFEGSEAAHTATTAALALLERLRGFERSVPGVGTFPLTLHIGVEQGPVALASAGQSDALRYCALGSTVNGVARAEGHGGKGELVLGPQAWQAVAAQAVGSEVAPGYWRVEGLHAQAQPTGPQLPAEHIGDTPDEAIPLLLQELDCLSPYLPAGLLARILADPQRPQVEADLRPVSVLFAQVVGLGALVESLGETQAAALLDTFLQPMQAAIARFGGVVNKLDLADEGDKLLAIFGAPVAYEDHGERAALAALDMLAAFDELRPTLDVWGREPSYVGEPQGSRLKLRIGLNTGTVFAGNVGTAERKEYTVMGDAVNVAARVMSSAAWGEIWCSDATAALVRERLVCDDRGRVAVKGKADPLPLFRLAGQLVAAAPATAERPPLVGRRQELATLRGQLNTVLGAQGCTVRVSGDAGVGKSRLVAEFVDEARAHGLTTLTVTCLSYAASIPYGPWAEWLKLLCGIMPGDTQATRAAKLRARLRDLGAGQEQWLPLLADLVRLDAEENNLTRALDPQLRQARTFELIIALLRYAAAPSSLKPQRSNGLLLLFEDLHWADQISLDLWQKVAASITDLPVLLLGVHRPGLAWGSGAQDDGATVLALHELTFHDSEALVTARLGDAALPQALREQLVLRAAGNPLFLEELLRAALELGGINEWEAASGPRSAQSTATPQSPLLLDSLPDSLNGLLLARIDRLDENSRALLRVASVIGQRFPVGVLQAVQSADQRTLLRQLTQLDGQELTLTEREEPERVHLFRHALLQEVAYQSLLYARRRELHRRIGDYLERRYSGNLETYYGLLAHHYRLSDQRDKAVRYLLLAGHDARTAYANDDALQYYRWAFELLHEPEAQPNGQSFDQRIWEVYAAMGDVLATVGRYDEAIGQYEAILAFKNRAGNAAIGEPGSHTTDDLLASIELPPAVAAEAHRSKGSALEKQGQFAAALDALTEAEELCRSNLDDVPPLLLSKVCADMGLVLMRRSEYDLAMAMCREGLNMVRRDKRSREDEQIEARLHLQLGNIYGMRGDYMEARHHFGSSLAAQEAIDDIEGMIRSNNNIGYVWYLQSEYERAITHYRVAEELARKINLRYMLSVTSINTAYSLYCLGRYEEAEGGCMVALVLCESMNDQRNIAHIQETLGSIAYCRGQYHQALERYAATLQIHRAAGSGYQQGNTLVHQAAAYNALGRYDEAAELAQEALARATELQTQQLKVEALNALAENHLLRGNMGQTTKLASEALELACELGSKFDQGIARRLLGEALGSSSEGEASDEQFQQSMALFEEIKQRFDLARSQAAYARSLAWRGNLSAAQTYLKQAQATFVSMGAQGELQRLAPLIERSV